MTSLMAWIGVDSRGPSSLYLSSDSRISWNQKTTWDYGRKLYASASAPELLGYCGTVPFPSQTLAQLTALIDTGSFLMPGTTAEAKYSLLRSTVKEAFEHYPADREKEFTIIYGTREAEGMKAIFRLAALAWIPGTGWNDQWISIPTASGIVMVLGSGRAFVQKWESRWRSTNQGGTSRSVFNAFCNALMSGDDPYSGGPPQLIGLYRKGPARTFGIIYKNTRFLFGTPLQGSVLLNSVEWRNTLFERCDPQTMELLMGAQQHRQPRGLGLVAADLKSNRK